MLRLCSLLGAAMLVAGCAQTPPQAPNNLCTIFLEKQPWHHAAVEAHEKWGAPIPVLMAMMYQESSFRHDAEPPMEYFLGFIPIGRVSSAYGYAQAKTDTWADYQRETQQTWADRDNFADAIDFMGWFVSKTQQVNGVSTSNAQDQYLSYHEGWRGFRQHTYARKPWLVQVAKKVDDRAKMYTKQYQACQDELDSFTWFDWFF